MRSKVAKRIQSETPEELRILCANIQISLSGFTNFCLQRDILKKILQSG